MRAVLALALAALLSAAPAPAPAAGSAPSSAARAPAFVAVVDAGHGGEKDGAVGPDGAKEKDLALQIARRVAAKLRAQGAEVRLTREADEPLELDRRTAIANGAEADLFLSIHLNSMPTVKARARAHGIETYFLSLDASDARASAVAARENADAPAAAAAADDPVAGILADLASADALAESSRLAQAIHARLVAAGPADRGVKQAPFRVLSGARMAAVLLEVGFISHPDESRLLASPVHQERLATAIAEGVAAYRAGAARAAR
jgi:N-acetylmuramoyl-L-alanine amidase